MNNYSERIRELRVKIARLDDKIGVAEFRADFRGGSELDADRCAEYSRDARGYNSERRALMAELTALRDAEFVETARAIVATGGEPWAVLTRLALITRYGSGPTKRALYDLVTWDDREPAVRLVEVAAILDAASQVQP